jgi:abhydrolase domain-containing protein 13
MCGTCPTTGRTGGAAFILQSPVACRTHPVAANICPSLPRRLPLLRHKCTTPVHEQDAVRTSIPQASARDPSATDSRNHAPAPVRAARPFLLSAASLAFFLLIPGQSSRAQASVARHQQARPLANVVISSAAGSSVRVDPSPALAVKGVETKPGQKKHPVIRGISQVIPRRTDPSVDYVLKCALIAGITSAVVVGITVMVFWIIQDSLVYKPTSVWRGNPKTWDMPYYEDVSYCTLDNVEITGWFIKQPPETYSSARTLIYFHGTDKNASFRLKKVVGFYETCKCNILLLSYRGYGTSTGKPNEKGVCIDAESALDYLQSRGDVDVSPGGKLWVFGESLGGAVAIHFTSKYEKQINALILENTFTSLLDMIKLEFPILGILRFLSRNRWQSKKRIGKLGVPILFLSGKRDSYIPPMMMRQMYELAENSQIREFVEFDEGTHNRTWTLEGFYESIDAFMEKVESLSTRKQQVPGSFMVRPGDGTEVVSAAA